MARPTGPAVAAVIQALRDKPYCFDFFQAVRWLESGCADLPRIGQSHRCADDAVKFHQHVALGFEPSSLHSFQETADASPPDLWVNFFGLLGPSGPMPLSITEYVYDRLQNHDDTTLAAFLDIFNHRMISLFYRAWARSQPTVSRDRRQDDWHADYVGSFQGIGSPAFHDRDAVPDDLKLFYSGRLACQTRNAEGLESILQDYLGLPVTLMECVGQWVPLSGQDRSQLGGGTNGSLGIDVILGSRCWESQQKFRIRIGPMKYRDFEALLPGGSGLSRLASWVRLYVGDELDWDVQFVLERREVPPICLGKQGRLGWSCWLDTSCPQEDPDDLVLTPSVSQDAVVRDC